MPLYPAALCVEGKRCAVIGGGTVGERKAASLLECKASVLVVSPECTPLLKAWTEQGRIGLRERNFQPGDLDGVMLAIAATSDKAVNEAVMLAGRERGVLVNVVLFAFNLFPLPPLDGGRILVGLLPIKQAMLVSRVEPFGFFIVIALVFTGFVNTLWMQPLMALTYTVLNFLLSPLAALIR